MFVIRIENVLAVVVEIFVTNLNDCTVNLCINTLTNVSAGPRDALSL